MFKKCIFPIIALILLAAVSAQSFEMLDSNINVPEKKAVIQIIPLKAALNCDIYINGGSSEKYMSANQIINYSPASNNKIKIDIVLPKESDYKSKTYIMDENIAVNPVTVKINLYRKLSPETRRIANLIVSSINSFAAYRESGNIDSLRAPTSDIGALYYIDKFIDDISAFDAEEITKFLDIIKDNIKLSAENSAILEKVTENINIMRGISIELAELKENPTLTASDKKSRQDKLSNKIMEVFWNCIDLNRLLK